MNKNSNYPLIKPRDFSLLWSNLKITNTSTSRSATATATNSINFGKVDSEKINLPHLSINAATNYIEDLTETIIKSVEKMSIRMSSSSEATRLCHKQSQMLREKFQSVYEHKQDKNFKYINTSNNFYNEHFFVKSQQQDHNHFLPQIEFRKHKAKRKDKSNEDENKYMKKRKKKKYKQNEDWMYGLYDAAQSLFNRQLIQQQEQQQKAREKPEPGFIVSKRKPPKTKVNIRFCFM